MAGELKYKDRVELRIGGVPASEIKSVVLIRNSAVSHSLNTDQRRLELWFKQKRKNKISFQTPATQGLAPPGYYFLYVVTKDNMPSVAKLVHFAG